MKLVCKDIKTQGTIFVKENVDSLDFAIKEIRARQAKCSPLDLSTLLEIRQINNDRVAWRFEFWVDQSKPLAYYFELLY